jgi:hypothetical protein
MTAVLKISDIGFAERMRDGFAWQQAMRLMRARLPLLAAERREIHLPRREGIGLQQGLVHGGGER